MTCRDPQRRRLGWRRTGAFGLVIFAAALAGCVEPPPPGPQAPPQAIPAVTPAAVDGATTNVVPQQSEPAAVATMMTPPAPAESMVPAAPPRPAGPQRPPAPNDPRRLVGLTQERLQSILGDANFVRRDGPAQIWRYDAEECSLDVFLFREGELQRVTHVASRARKADSPDMPLNDCYARVLGARRALPSG